MPQGELKPPDGVIRNSVCAKVRARMDASRSLRQSCEWGVGESGWVGTWKSCSLKHRRRSEQLLLIFFSIGLVIQFICCHDSIFWAMSDQSAFRHSGEGSIDLSMMFDSANTASFIMLASANHARNQTKTNKVLTFTKHYHLLPPQCIRHWEH